MSSSFETRSSHSYNARKATARKASLLRVFAIKFTHSLFKRGEKQIGMFTSEHQRWANLENISQCPGIADKEALVLHAIDENHGTVAVGVLAARSLTHSNPMNRPCPRMSAMGG